MQETFVEESNDCYYTWMPIEILNLISYFLLI